MAFSFSFSSIRNGTCDAATQPVSASFDVGALHNSVSLRYDVLFKKKSASRAKIYSRLLAQRLRKRTIDTFFLDASVVANRTNKQLVSSKRLADKDGRIRLWFEKRRKVCERTPAGLVQVCQTLYQTDFAERNSKDDTGARREQKRHVHDAHILLASGKQSRRSALQCRPLSRHPIVGQVRHKTVALSWSVR